MRRARIERLGGVGTVLGREDVTHLRVQSEPGRALAPSTLSEINSGLRFDGPSGNRSIVAHVRLGVRDRRRNGAPPPAVLVDGWSRFTLPCGASPVR